MASEGDERQEELETLTAIYPELRINETDPFLANLELAVKPANPLLVRFIPNSQPENVSYAKAAQHQAAYVEHDVEISRLPPLSLEINLPEGYPSVIPPKIRLSTKFNWLSKEKIEELERDAATLWEDYGRCQVLFAYIDHLQQAADRGFDLEQTAEGCLVLPVDLESELVVFNTQTSREDFNSGTYDCGICLDPKKGSSCYQMERCRHIFCRQCLQDFYNNAIKEGDVANVRCLDPDCSSDETRNKGTRKKKRKRSLVLHPRELLAMGIEETAVRRYMEMKRKKKLEADKTTVYCPRTWCQGAAKSKMYPPVPDDLTTYIPSDLSSDEDSERDVGPESPQGPPKNPGNKKPPPSPTDRLEVCEKCSLAFCRVCYMVWHGPFARCYPRDPNELSAEEKASYEYIRLNTSPCPYCNAPVQKTMGCNHMSCFQCRTHFCYLCSSWLDGQNPYQHFNKPGSPCYQRLWELEGGDEGQGPDDGRGFGGGRGWEQLAMQAAREAEAAEAEAAAVAAAAQVEEGAQAGRGRRAGGVQRPLRPELDARQQAELQRFLELAQRDEEDEWDSDGFGEEWGAAIG